MTREDNDMSIDAKALDNAADTFSRSMRALNSMEIADLPPELDQDARDLARIIQEHGPDYADTEHGDMTAPLLESLARLVQAAKAADRLAALEEQLHLTNVDALQTEAERAALEAENQRLRAALDVIANFETDSPHDVAMEALAAGGAVSERIEDSGRQHRRAAMRKRNGWCIWSPWSGFLSSTFAGTRTECIKVFERDTNSPWRRYREQGFECRPVLFVDARKESGDA